jgi:gliding motility-associated protein GldM
MAGGKETPRQKMIGMMYLVLTALLALNVSKDILDAFIQIDDGLAITNQVLDDKAKSTLNALQNPKPGEEEKAKPYAAKAAEVEQLTKEMMDYIEEMKARVMASSHNGNADGTGYEEYMENGKSIRPGALDEKDKPRLSKKDENQNNTSLLVGSDPKNPRTDAFSANALRVKLTEFKDKLLAIEIPKENGKKFELAEDVKASLNSTFAFPDGVGHDKIPAVWETHNFYHMPLVAVIANLSKIQTDVMNAKNNVLANLATGINASDMKFTDVTVAVVPQQSYVIKGDEYSVEVYLAAFNKTSQTKVYMGGQYNGDTKPTNLSVNPSPTGTPILSNEEGKCVFKTSTGGMSLGAHGYTGQIEYMKDGEVAYLPFATPPFFVGEAALVVSPTNMNVFYRGLDNPVEVSVPGVDKSLLKVSMEGGTITGPSSDGTYNVKPGAGKEATIRVTAKVNGKDTQMPAKKFRIKSMPDPVPSFGGKKPSDNVIGAAELAGALGVRAQMENFDFPVTATVSSFVVSIYANGSWKDMVCNGNQLSAEAKAAIGRLKKGEKFYIEKIMCKLPDGSERKLSSITLRVS